MAFYNEIWGRHIEVWDVVEIGKHFYAEWPRVISRELDRGKTCINFALWRNEDDLNIKDFTLISVHV